MKYTFEIELAALREIINQEHMLDHKYLKPKYANIKPVQVILEGFLNESIKDREERRNIRLAMLSLWVEHRLESTYGLTIYQCSAITRFLQSDNGSIDERARRFLEDSKAAIEAEDLSRKIPSNQSSRTVLSML